MIELELIQDAVWGDFKLLRHLNELCEDDFLLKTVKKQPLAFAFVKNPTEEMCLAVVKIWGLAISKIKNPSEAVCLAAIKETGLAIGCIKNPTEEMCWVALQESVWAILDIKNPTEDMLIAVAGSGNVRRNLKPRHRHYNKLKELMNA